MLLLAVGLAVGLTNSVKPVHIDDTVYLAIARQITKQPLDPYGGELNWMHITQPTYLVSTNPPLLSYYFAAVMMLAGNSEFILHLAMIPWVLLAGWSMTALAERWLDDVIPAPLWVVISPTFVLGLNLMLDVPMLALSTTSVLFFWLASEQNGRRWHLVTATVAATLAVSMKHPAIALVPVAATLGFARRNWRIVFSSLTPLIALAGWQAYCLLIYDLGQLSQALGFLDSFRQGLSRQLPERLLAMLAILGSTFPLWIWFLLTGQGKLTTAIAGAVSVGATLFYLPDWAGESPYTTTGFIVAVVLGGTVFIGPFWNIGCKWQRSETRVKRSRRIETVDVLLAVWAGSFAFFAVFYSPFVAPRSFLPIHFPIAALTLRQSPVLCGSRRGVFAATSALMLTTSALLFWTDYRWSAGYRSAASQINQRYGSEGRSIFFLGHWGWQYYPERAGFVAWDPRWTAAPAGSLIVMPLRAHRQEIDPRVLARLRKVLTITVGPHPCRLTVWNRASRIHFHAGGFLQLPWGFSNEPIEELTLWRVAR